MSIAVIITDRNTDHLCQSISRLLPEVDIQQWPDINHPEQVKLAVLWNHPEGITDPMKELKMVVSMGAGMDHIEADSRLPVNIRTGRIVTLALQQNMAQYVLQHILNDHRHQHAYLLQQQSQVWQVLESDDAMPTVGVLGLGQLGTFVADRCADLGFRTMAWTHRQEHPLHPCFHGSAGLKHVCQNSQYLIVLLPLNEQTHHIINATSISWCRPEVMLMNVGRGKHVDEAALLAGLDSGRLRHAVLDVFEQEPLPKDHPFWQHPKITVTPHSSSRSDIEQTAGQIADKYLQLIGQANG